MYLVWKRHLQRSGFNFDIAIDQSYLKMFIETSNVTHSFFTLCLVSNRVFDLKKGNSFIDVSDLGRRIVRNVLKNGYLNFSLINPIKKGT